MSNWVAITTDAVKAALAKIVVDAAQIDDERLTPVLAQVVARVRGAIRDAKKQAVSATAGTVPPGPAEQHVPVLAAWAMVSGAPGTAGLAINGVDGAEQRGFTDLYDRAEEWLKAVSEGTLLVEAPTDGESGNVSRTVVIASGGVRLTREHCRGL